MGKNQNKTKLKKQYSKIKQNQYKSRKKEKKRKFLSFLLA
jgi:hypothetical protein